MAGSNDRDRVGAGRRIVMLRKNALFAIAIVVRRFAVTTYSCPTGPGSQVILRSVAIINNGIHKVDRITAPFPRKIIEPRYRITFFLRRYKLAIMFVHGYGH